ncbi:MAG: RodZ domain-containing protein [Alphaproteobacteria bacterium]
MVRLNPRSLRVLNQEGGTDSMQSVEGADHVGAFLREARENTGRSLADVAQILRIRWVYLQAIEDGRFDELPGAAYAVGFVRSYATYLRLDVPEVVARFKEEATGIEAPQELDFPTPVPEGRFPGGVIVTACIVIAAAGTGGWYWWQSQKNLDIARVPAPPETPSTAFVSASSGAANASAPVVVPEPAESTVAAVETVTPMPETATPVETPPAPDEKPATPEETAATEAPADVAAVPRSYLQPATDPLSSAANSPDIASGTTEAGSAASATAEPAAAERLPVPPQLAEVPSAAPAAPTAVSAPAETRMASLPAVPEPVALAADNDARTDGLVNRDARIVLSAREDNTWVQVMDSQENTLLTQMLRSGDRYLVPDRPGLSLRTNNAGGLDISVDGAEVPSIGGQGDIRHEVRLDPDLLKSGTAVIR